MFSSLTRNEAAVYRRETLRREVIVLLQEDGPVPPLLAKKLDLRERARLHNSERHSFSHTCLANDKGHLRTGQVVVLKCWGKALSTCDSEIFNGLAELEFCLLRNKTTICQLVRRDGLQAFSHALPERVLAAMDCAIGGSEFAELRRNARRIQAQCRERLREELASDFGLEVLGFSWILEHEDRLEHAWDILLEKIANSRGAEKHGHAATIKLPQNHETTLIPFSTKKQA